MKTTENIKLTTAGKLHKELKKHEKKRGEYDIEVWLSDDDDTSFCVVGTELDKDGDLCIYLEDIEWSEGYYCVRELLDELSEYDKDTKVYLAGAGLYLNFDLNGDGSVFCDPDDENESLGCYTSSFGEYDYEPHGMLTEKEERRAARRYTWRTRKDNWKGILEGITFLLCIPLTVYGLYYNIAALVKHSRPLWESILWIPFLLLLLWVCIMNLVKNDD